MANLLQPYQINFLRLLKNGEFQPVLCQRTHGKLLLEKAMKLSIGKKPKSANAIRKDLAIAFAKRVYKKAPKNSHIDYNVREMLQRLLHQQRFPAMHLHPRITEESKRHWHKPPYLKSFTGTGRHNKFGKGQVFYTQREGGNWQKWPWNWVPDFDSKLEQALSIYKKKDNLVAIEHPDMDRYLINVHSMLINGRRWDCVNGWNN